MAIWRHSFERNGWQFRLDVIDYASNMSASVNTIPVGGVIEAGAIEQEFDDIPVGLVKGATWSVTFNMSRLDSGLQTYLDYGEGAGEARNCFILYSDRGTGGTVTDNVEFCGVHADVAGTTYKTADNGDVLATFELVDAVSYTLTTTAGTDVFTGANASDSTNRNFAYHVAFSGTATSEYYEQTEDSTVENFRVSGWTDIASVMRTGLTSAFKNKTARTANATTTAVDSGSMFDDLLTTTAVWYKASATTPRAAGAAMTKSELRFITNVRDSSGTTVGGLYYDGDEVSFAAVESMADLLRDICEAVGAKVWYKFVYNAGGGSPYISVEWRIAAVGDNPGFALSGSEATVSVLASLDPVEYVKGEHAVTVGEASVKVFGDGVTDKFRVNVGSARASRSFNVADLPVHNCLVPLPDVRVSRDDTDLFDVYSVGVFHTNIVFYLDANGAPVKAHEKTRIYQDSTNYVEYDPAEAANVPVLEGEDVAQYKSWACDVNETGAIGYTLAQYYAQTFNSRHITTFDVVIRTANTMTDESNGTLAFLGYKWTVNDEPNVMASNAVDFTKAVCTGISWDVMSMTTKITLTCLSY